MTQGQNERKFRFPPITRFITARSLLLGDCRFSGLCRCGLGIVIPGISPAAVTGIAETGYSSRYITSRSREPISRIQ